MKVLLHETANHVFIQSSNKDIVFHRQIGGLFSPYTNTLIVKSITCSGAHLFFPSAKLLLVALLIYFTVRVTIRTRNLNANTVA